jgi:tetratricopeptide (TPR) repeat protein
MSGARIVDAIVANAKSWLCAACVLLAGCGSELSPMGRLSLEAGRQAFADGNHGSVRMHMTDVLCEGMRTSGAPEALYYRGRSTAALGDTANARVDLEKALAIAKDKNLAGGCALLLGDLDYDEGAFADALRYYDLALANLPVNETPADHVGLRLASLLQRFGQWERADVILDRLIFHFEGTPRAREAGRIIRCRSWTINAGAYESRNEAASLVQRLKDNNLPARIDEIVWRDCMLQAVNVGSFDKYDQADEALPDVKRHIDCAVVMESR